MVKWPRLDAERKRFREYLNTEYADTTHTNGRFGQGADKRGLRQRPYGDYLWAQDRGMFEWNFSEWKEGKV